MNVKSATNPISKANQAANANSLLPDLCTFKFFITQLITGQLLVILLLLATSDLGSMTWLQVVSSSILVQAIVMSCTAVLCGLQPILKRIKLRAAITISFAIILLLTITISIMAESLNIKLNSNEAINFSLVDQAQIDWMNICRNLAIGIIIGGAALRYFYLRFYVRQQLVQREQSELEARIQALQSRIRPHFLFNSMNIITSLISTDPDTAETVVEDLSELFRASLNEVGNQVNLQEELTLCQRYMRIEALRLGDRLQVNWQVNGVPKEVKIPLLTIQPVLENAIYHGIQPLPQGGVIDVEVNYDNGQVLVCITNPLSQNRQRKHTSGNRMALDNIRDRLNALYGGSALLTTEEEESRFVTKISYAYPIDR